MASRFTLYQTSVKKFITNQSTISSYQYKDALLKLMETSEFILPITLLTIMNGQLKKNKIKLVNGYEMATGIELFTILMEIIHFNKGLTKPHGLENMNVNTINILQTTIVSLINTSFCHNLELVIPYQNHISTVEIMSCGMKQINDKVNKITSAIMNIEIPENTKSTSKSDLKNFHFRHNQTFEKFQAIKQLPKDFILKYINDTYGNACKLTLILGWLLGGSRKDMIDNLDRLGYHFGILLKIAYDFSNINSDINDGIQKKMSLNYVINFGLQDAFELFDESRKKFIEGLLTLDITSTTIKEFIDILEKKVNDTLENSSPDIRRTSSVSL